MALKTKLDADRLATMRLLGSVNRSETPAYRQAIEWRLSALRSALTAVAKVETSFKERRELTDEELVAVLRKEVAQRVEAARIYGEADAKDRQERETFEASTLEAYLPAQLTEAATRELVASIIAEQKLAGPQAIGRVMGALKLRSDVDKGLASRLARELL